MTISLGDKIRNFRKRSGLSQLELESEIGASSGTVSRIENGEVNPTKETVQRIAEILELNNHELDYLIGQISKLVTPEEVNLARNHIKSYFSKKNTLAYLLDERGIFWDMSLGFRILAELTDDKKFEKLIGRSMPLLIFDDAFGFKKYLSEEKFEETVLQSFYRTYEDIHFMKGEDHYEEVMALVDKTPFLKRAWTEFEKNGGTPMLTEEGRTVYFNYNGHKIKMNYSIESVPKFRRFRVFDFKPANFLIRILSKFQ
jgi:transcriptional regulator with XRE-family HTH domain